MSKKHTTTISAAPGGVPRLAGNSNEPTSALQIVAPGTLSAASSGDIFNLEHGAEIGIQLTEQYRKATGGMTEVLRFGAMMMQLSANLSARGQVSRGGRGNKDGFSEWLRVFAPEINRTTAYRFLHVAEAVAQDFQLPSKISFVELATSTPESLSEPLRNKQIELWDFVNGTSQRSWLDRFAPVKSKGGDTSASRKKLTPQEEYEMEILCLESFFNVLLRAANDFVEKRPFQIMPDADIDRSINILSDALKAAQDWRKMPKRDRQVTAIKQLPS